MKKWLCFILTICLLLPCLSGCDPAFMNTEENTETKTESRDPNEAEQSPSITMAEIVHANSTAKLREIYNSFSITYTYSDGYVFDYYVDRDTIFEMDNEDYCAVFTETDCIYYDSGYYGQVLYAGITPDISWSRWLALDDHDALWETVMRATLRDGKLYVNTFVPAEYIDDVYNDIEDLSSVMIAYVLDAETYVILESTTTYKFTDGSYDTMESRMKANVATPDELHSLMQHISDPSDTRTFTIILDPDTSYEAAYSVTLPKEDYVEFYYPDDYTALYLDRACTQLATEEDLNTLEDLTVYAKALYPESETAGSL
ncbi:MAG: hypothetical protein IJW00_02015 [Clostridia bacterium]|nr:hypothetical protein [Clostridia bacterium]